MLASGIGWLALCVLLCLQAANPFVAGPRYFSSVVHAGHDFKCNGACGETRLASLGKRFVERIRQPWCLSAPPRATPDTFHEERVAFSAELVSDLDSNDRQGKARALKGNDEQCVGRPVLRRGSTYDNVPIQAFPRDGAYNAVLVVPTGIGASIGGYAGDALPVARVMSSVVDNLITHPNVMNGAMLSAPSPRIQYVEGYALDEFCAGRWGLLPMRKGGHRIGLVLDCGMDEDLRLRHVQAANAARATLGINVAEYCMTEEPAGVSLEMTGAGASWGAVKGLGALVAAGKRLVDEAGCTALAVVARFPDEDDEAFQAYREGHGVDAIGGAEAIISHVMTQKLKVPCAHAPAMPAFEADEAVSPRACAEELGYTFLPCVLSNLHRAPSLVTSRGHPKAAWALWADDIDAVVAPATAFGGAGVLSLADQAATLLIGVEDNATVMKASGDVLLGDDASANRYVRVSSYLEAIGVIAAHRAGINPACLTPDAPGVRQILPSLEVAEDEAHRETLIPQRLHA